MQCNDISRKWCDQNEHLRVMSEPLAQNEFQLDKLQRCFSSEFKVLSFMTQTQYHLQKLYQDPEQFKFNRNAHIMTYQPTRVTIGNENQKNQPQNYINANMIDVEGKNVIATQGPLTSTFYNFWRLCEQYQVSSIFMLCGLLEKNKKKCDRYWPNQETEGGKIYEQQYEITLLHQTDIIEEQKFRKILLKNTNNGYQKIIQHYQELNWSDGGIPLAKDFNKINSLLNLLVTQLKNNKLPVVHCSAGVGRTGTFISMALFHNQIENDKAISVFDTVRHLRQQRWGMVYTCSQYQFLYDYVQRQINKKIKKQKGLLESDDE